jgi:hypothetical protein
LRNWTRSVAPSGSPSDPVAPYHRVTLTQPAQDHFWLLTEDEQDEVRRILGLIQVDPSIDGVHKIVFPMPPLILTAYVTSQFWVVYRVLNTSIRVVSIWRIRTNGSSYC